MTSILWGVLVGVLAASSDSDCSNTHSDFVIGAVFAEKRLWVWYQNGCLVSVPEGKAQVRAESPGDRVIAAC
jgi:hypothetical protein